MKLLAPRINRFILISLLFVALDVGLYAVLVSIKFPSFIAAFIATSTALVGTYVLFLKFVYEVQAGIRTFARYALITLAGVWVVQQILIAFVGTFLPSTATFRGAVADIVLKLITEAGVIVWNYIWYERYVFVLRPGTKPARNRHYSPYNYTSKK